MAATSGTIAKRRTTACRVDFAACAAVLLLLAAMPSFADAPKLPDVLKPPPDNPKLKTPAQKEAPTAFAGKEPTPIPGWGVGDAKSWWIPAFDILTFDYTLNRFDHYVVDDQVYGSPMSNLRQNLRKKWIVDTDPFAVNQFYHPYQGSMYQGFARSAGLNFWEASAYTFLGSAMWELAGEHTTPSINDQIATGIGGNFLGEPLFRMASLLLETSGSESPGFWRELGATVISPATGANRLFWGDRFDGVFRSHDPAVFTRIDLGYIVSTRPSTNVTDSAGLPQQQPYRRHQASLDSTIAYGLPGKPGYTYTRPFDYFHFEFTAATSNTFENIISRGLLYGTDYAAGDNYRGIWGLYGTYDYIAPQIFRVSTTGLGLGTTGQWWLSRTIALQGTLLGGVGYGAGGVTRGAGIGAPGTTGEGQRDYHYGFTPQELIAARVIFGDRFSIDSSVRDYSITHLAASESDGSENIFRADISLTLRVYNLHGLTVRYTDTRRNAHYGTQAPTTQSVGAISLVYSLLGQTHFGAVDWRPASEGGPLK